MSSIWNRRSHRHRRALVSQSGFFDESWYIQTYDDVASSELAPLDHFVRYGSRELRDPGPGFNAKWYYETYPDARSSRLEPLFHFICVGKAENRAIIPSLGVARKLDHESRRRAETVLASGFFDPAWYLNKYPDIRLSGQEPLVHFVEYGSRELRDPGPDFEAKWYAQQYLELLERPYEPLFHYIEIGARKNHATKGPPPYTRWRVLFDVLDEADTRAIARHIQETVLPKLVVAVVFNETSEPMLGVTASALADQLYADWTATFFLAEACSDAARLHASKIASADPRIIARTIASPTELFSSLGDEETVVFAQGGVTFRNHALYMFAHTLRGSEKNCLIYADEDRRNPDGTPVEPRFKPDYSPILFAQASYHEDCFLLRPDGGWAQYASANWSLDSDFVSLLFKMAISKRATGLHIPFILSHNLVWRSPDHITTAPSDLSSTPQVSIIIPTKDRLELLRPCLISLEDLTDYPHERMEVIVVDNGSTEPEAVAYLEEKSAAGEIRLIRHSGVFNFSRLNNVAVLNATGNVLVFLNNDIEITDPQWLRRLVALAVQPDVGAVGAKLLYPDNTVQHGGVVLGIQGVAAHSHVGVDASAEGFQRLNKFTREVSAVTGACLAMRRELFCELGGFDPALAVAFNDTALCLAARRRGKQNVWVSDALLIHHESKSRGFDSTPERKMAFAEEARLTRLKFKDQLDYDPFYSPNLSLETIYELAFPPRRSKPWQIYTRKYRKPRVLILSEALALGQGVAVVITLQAAFLAQHGFDVFVGGPKTDREMPCSGCTRVVLTRPEEAAIFIARNAIDCVVAHTPAFISTSLFLSSFVPLLFYDHGEPPARLFPDAALREQVLADKRFWLTFATRHIAISDVVAAEARERSAIIIANGNSHLAVWNDDLAERRIRIRKSRGWEGRTIVLNVCRFGRDERYYKGIDVYADVVTKVKMRAPGSKVSFVLCGKATKEDAFELESFGIDAALNVSDEEMIDVYCAADIYANFSKWEGYNLGIGQALAMGLPVIASDIPAHRAFPIFVSNNKDEIVRSLLEHARTPSAERDSSRKPLVTEWEPSLLRTAEVLRQMINSGAAAEKASSHCQQR